MKLKCLVGTDSGAIMLITRDFESMEIVYAELEAEGYRVYSISTFDANEFRERI